MKKIALVTIGMFLLVIPTICAEIDGQWIGVKDGPDGKKMELRYRFKAEGGTLIGLLESRLGGGTISGGRIDGNAIGMPNMNRNLIWY